MPLSEEQRFPLLDQRGAQNLKWLRQHPHAPRWNYVCGDMLSRESLEEVRSFERDLNEENIGWQRGEVPKWLQRYVRFCEREVPFYRTRKERSSTRSDNFFDLPTIARGDIAPQPWSFVPDCQPLDELVMYGTSGTTGTPLPLLSHPRVSSMYLPLIKRALKINDIEWNFDDHRIALAQVNAQKKTLTYLSVSSFLNNAGYAKINLHSDEWNAPGDAMKFLESCAPPVLTGDPVAFAELMRLHSKGQHIWKPRALVSSATTLLPALKTQLESYFACPAIDMVSSNEAGIIASSTREGDGFEILPHDLYVETLREDGSICDDGEQGEIVVSGGRNPFLSLLRYHTGDHGRLTFRLGKPPRLHGFVGRAPVTFRSEQGEAFTSVDVYNALRPFALGWFQVHQNSDKSVRLRIPTDDDMVCAALKTALHHLFGDVALQIETVATPENPKTLCSSDVE